jgi:hypothetical protein
MDVCLHRSLYDTVRSYAQGKGNQREKEQEIHQKPAQSAESRRYSGLTTLSRRMAGIPPRERMKSFNISKIALRTLHIYRHHAVTGIRSIMGRE